MSGSGVKISNMKVKLQWDMSVSYLDHVDQTRHVGGEHCLCVFFKNVWCFCYPFDKTTTFHSVSSLAHLGVDSTHALLTRTSISWNCGGKEPTKFRTSSALLTSSFKGSTWTPEPTSALILSASAFKESIRRAVKISLRLLGEVFANSSAFTD